MKILDSGVNVKLANSEEWFVIDFRGHASMSGGGFEITNPVISVEGGLSPPTLENLEVLQVETMGVPARVGVRFLAKNGIRGELYTVTCYANLDPDNGSKIGISGLLSVE
jgi:hypothetical protein